MNASVEFDQRTLRPTYRLVWGAAGASHALSVAEGLKFDPTVLADARQIATAGRDAVMTGGKGTAQAQAIQVLHAGVLPVLQLGNAALHMSRESFS